LLLKKLFQLLLCFFVKIMFNAEFLSKLFRCIPWVNNDTLLVVTSKVNINEKERLHCFFIIVVIVLNVRIIIVFIVLVIVFFNVGLIFYLVFVVFVVDCISLVWLNVHRLISLLCSWSTFFFLLKFSLFA